MQELARVVERIAQSDIPAFILGDAGSGKDFVARLLHRRSPRRLMPFLKLSCGTLVPQAMEKELFGAIAHSAKESTVPQPGILERAQGGTIFLDEISRMPLNLQAKLLPVLKDKQVVRPASAEVLVADVRWICSSSRPMEKLLAAGKFLKELYCSLNVVTVKLPPLRERKEDITALANHFLKKHQHLCPNGPIVLTDQILRQLMQRDWPGNVRELEKTIQYLLVSRGQLPPGGGQGEEMFDLSHPEDDNGIVPLKEAARRAAWRAECEMILRALRKTNWNRRQAAEMLCISYKAMLYKSKAAGFGKRRCSAAPAEELGI
jgi:DNA-binding NtrC family response regulator